ncbi:MAG: methylated-DNA--[protein]-cysteine S-methyltransferase [Acholeplasmataceae bacterium]
MIAYDLYNSPIGPLYMVTDKDRLIKLTQECPNSDVPRIKTETHQKVITQLEAYFDGKRTTFDLPLKIQGSTFSLKVYDALKKIPFGQTITYGDLAKIIGQPKAARAVGGALNKNPIMIILPCHRVIGHNQALVGFRGGLALKKTLLDIEKKNMV